MEKVFRTGQFDSPCLDFVYRLQGKLKSHFLRSGSVLGKTMEEWTWQGVILAPCGCRLILFTTAHKDAPFLDHIYGLLHDTTIVVTEKCEEAIVPILQKYRWHEFVPPTFGRLPPGSPMPSNWLFGIEEWKEEEKRLEELTAQKIREYKGESFVPVGKFTGRGKSLIFNPLDMGKRPEDYGFANP